MNRQLTEPLVHFPLLGAAIFAIFSSWRDAELAADLRALLIELNDHPALGTGALSEIGLPEQEIPVWPGSGSGDALSPRVAVRGGKWSAHGEAS